MKIDQQLDLQARFSAGERKYFDTLKAELLELFRGRSYEEIYEQGDSIQMKKISDKLAQIQEFIETRHVDYDPTRKHWLESDLLAWARKFNLSREGFNDKGQVDEYSWVLRTLVVVSGQVVVKKDLALDFTTVAELPNNLHVEGGLHLRGTPLDHLPENLYVGSTLDIGRTKVKKLPRNMNVGRLILEAVPLESVAADLRVAGDVLVAGLSEEVMAILHALKDRGQIKGRIKNI